jgi:hypothetical protein
MELVTTLHLVKICVIRGNKMRGNNMRGTIAPFEGIGCVRSNNIPQRP